ncbi:MAG: sulfur carrier protein ThiS [Candidatus Hydrogenedentes bacterium]|nr:sulfur carrier protein ThiS [Candidatus Hydrogenedentota bacterium]
MHLTVNGELRDVPEEVTLAGLMQSLGLKPELTAVQRNDDIVSRDEHATTILLEGDTIELIRIVGGG